jgi:tRNA-specific 2-thiouridylase
MRCNEKIKFAALLERAIELGFDAVCTGHYATLVDGADGLELHRASDAAKDQSYVLGVLTAEQLAHTYFPLGSTPSKALVRAEAAERGLSVAQKPDSHDICFIPDGDTRGWLAEKVGAEQGDPRPGRRVVGTHDGAHAFTVGQRRGLRLGVPAPTASRGSCSRCARSRTPSWSARRRRSRRRDLGRAALLGRSCAGRGEFVCEVQIRAHADPVPARAFVAEDATVVPDEPLDGVAPGQSAVLYVGTRVLGQFTIDRTVSAVPAGV